MSALSQVMTRPAIRSKWYVVLTPWEFRALCRFAAIDWVQRDFDPVPHALFEGREVIRVETLGL